MTRLRFNVAPILVVFVCALGMSAFGQDLFEQHDAKSREAEMTGEKAAAEENESIF